MTATTQAVAQCVSLAGEAVWLRPDRTAWLAPAGCSHETPSGQREVRDVPWPAGGTLLVADVHLGKAHQFSARGLPLPASVRQGADGDTLTRLLHALHTSHAARLVVLGDLFHGPQGGDSVARFAEAMASWAVDVGERAELVLIGGNHDTRARADLGPLQQRLGARLLHLPEHGHWRQGALACTHHPAPVPDAGYTLCGHWHPCVSLRARARDHLRLPCFWLGDPVRRPLGVLPAFGAFTGMHPAEPGPGDQLWAITPQGLHPLST